MESVGKYYRYRATKEDPKLLQDAFGRCGFVHFFEVVHLAIFGGFGEQ